MKRIDGQIIYSPSDLVTYLKSPFAAWMDRYELENKGQIVPDELSAEEKLITKTGNDHEEKMLERFRETYGDGLIEIPKRDFAEGNRLTLAALGNRAPMVYQAALQMDQFEGWADFIKLESDGSGSDGLGSEGWYQVWDSKLARSPKPYYAIQLCCYSEMLAETLKTEMPKRFGIILGNEEDVEFAIEDFYYYYLQLKHDFLEMQKNFTGDFSDRPEPLPMAEHGRWSSHAEKYFVDTDHLVRVAGIKGSQIKKLNDADIMTMSQLAEASGSKKTKLAQDTLEKLVAQARLQCSTMAERTKNPKAEPCFEILTAQGKNGEAVGLALLPPAHEKDVFFDMESYPLAPGGLEYLFGVCTREIVIVNGKEKFEFLDWWGHDREGEKRAFEDFIDWVYDRWKSDPEMHIYHYGAYEKTALRKLSTLHDTRQDEVDNLLRNNVLVDLYKIVLGGVRIGEESYSIKSVEKLYFTRKTDVNTAVDSVVQYANWIESGESRDWKESELLLKIREYNEEDCNSTIGLEQWLCKQADKNKISASANLEIVEQAVIGEEIENRNHVIDELREKGDDISLVLADLVGFHRREEKPKWWEFFDRIEMTDQQLQEDADCLVKVEKDGDRVQDGRSWLQTYKFDATQECKLKKGSEVYFTHSTKRPLTLFSIDRKVGVLQLRATQNYLDANLGGAFPEIGSLVSLKIVRPQPIPDALVDIAQSHIENTLRPTTRALLERCSSVPLERACEDMVENAKQIVSKMKDGCLVIQGPPGTGKTYTASQMIIELLRQNKRIGITSNSHKAVINLMRACVERSSEAEVKLAGVKGTGEGEINDPELQPFIEFVKGGQQAIAAFTADKNIIGGTAWLFSHSDICDKLDYLFIDEAGQVPLANAVAMSRAAHNLVLLGDQMQLEQPVQGKHPGYSGLSVLQWMLLDEKRSIPDRPVFHSVVPEHLGLFLSESRRMHSSVCKFISESIYERKLKSHPDCDRQLIGQVDSSGDINVEHGIVFVPVEHEGNTQQSDEEVNRVLEIWRALLGRDFTDNRGDQRKLTLEDFLFIAPYNAQVRALEDALPKGARVGSVDMFQGQEAPVCIYTLCSSYGEYGARGLEFILNQNRVNVAISRAKCLAVVVGDPRICRSPATKIEEMKLINLLCKIKQISA